MGGLGVLDLRFFGFALRLRWEWLSRAEPQRCWVSLPLRAERSVRDMCAANLSVVITKLWTNNWSVVGALHLFAPALFAATSKAGRRRVLRDALPNHRWARDITGAPTTQVFCDYFHVWELLRSVNLEPLQSDRFVWRWSPDGRGIINL